MKDKIKYSLFLILISFLLVECILRFLDFEAGYFKNYKNYTATETIEIYDLYVTDENGIYTFNPSLLNSFSDSLSKDVSPSSKLFYQENVDLIFKDFSSAAIMLNQNKNLGGNEFLINIANQLQKSEDSIFNKALLSYLNKPFNEEGFRSISFHDSLPKQKILVLGDSYVFGMSANPYYNSFCDILLSRSYALYNTGINGTDPAQYYAVAEKYIPTIKPDIIIVNFSTASDLMLFQRNPKQDEPHEHFTNLGFIESNPLGKYLSAAESFEYYKNLSKIQNENFIEKIVAKSVCLSIIYGAFVELNIISHPYYSKYKQIREETSTTKMALNSSIYFKKIDSLAHFYNTPIVHAVIPAKMETFKTNPNFNNFFVDTPSLNTIFGKNNYFYPENLNKEDYEEGGDHFNNSGAEKYANFLESLIIEFTNESK